MSAPLAHSRFAHQGVTLPAASPSEAVGRLLAVQAQDLGQALWAVGLRCGGTRADVQRALAAGEIVRTWPMRGTLHLLAASDARWMVELLAPRQLASQATRRKQLELDEDILSRCRDHLQACLAEGPKSRDALMVELEAIGVSTASQRGYHVLLHLAQNGVICQVGPDKDTFVLMDAVVAPSAPRPREEALADLARRYFSGHGPATETDLAWWAGLPLRDVRVAIEGAREHLVSEELDGTTCWSAASDELHAPELPAPGVHLLPGFDELLLGYRDRSAVLAPQYAPRVCPGANGVFRPTVAVDGRMVATWRAKATRRGLQLSYEPFEEGGFDADAVSEAASRYESYLGRAVDDA
jgi:hypothetical protein